VQAIPCAVVQSILFMSDHRLASPSLVAALDWSPNFVEVDIDLFVYSIERRRAFF
jgi:hypothetical protein